MAEEKIKVTLDTNCIIDLEGDRPSAPSIRQMISLNDAGKISLQIVAISASENKKGGGAPQDYREYLQRIEAAGLEGSSVLMPTGPWGMTFWGAFIWSGEESKKAGRKIHEILFPGIEFDCRDYVRRHHIADHPIDPKWRNAKCDVLMIWSHIHYGGGIFVTNDGNFHIYKEPLIKLGAGEIMRPEQAIGRLVGSPTLP